MSLKEIARFADLSEAQIAASRLRSEGVQVLVQNEYWGGADYLMTIAMGGFRLWAPADQAADAKALIATLRSAPVEPLDEPLDEDDEAPIASPATGMARTGLALILGLAFGWAAGWLVVGPRRPVAVTGVVVVLITISILSVAVIIGTWAAYAGHRLAPLP